MPDMELVGPSGFESCFGAILSFYAPIPPSRNENVYTVYYIVDIFYLILIFMGAHSQELVCLDPQM